MKLFSTKMLVFICLLLISPFCFAQYGSILGLWRTYDNAGQARSILKFSQVGDSAQGRIVKAIPVAAKDNVACSKCTGSNKNKPLAGMVIVWGLTKKGNQWVNGTVLDVDSGKTYACNVTVSEDGHTLHLYAHLGPFGKTIDWSRVR